MVVKKENQENYNPKRFHDNPGLIASNAANSSETKKKKGRQMILLRGCTHNRPLMPLKKQRK